jgi:phosphoribosyl 1,2-cyclic phosphate phosphodiesterase
VSGTRVRPFAVPHGRAEVMGFRIGALGYVTDAKTLPAEALDALAGVEVLVLNALLRSSHPTHLSISEAVAMAQRVGASRTFLTHLTHDNFHADLAAELPSGIAPAFDGLVIDLSDAPTP